MKNAIIVGSIIIMGGFVTACLNFQPGSSGANDGEQKGAKAPLLTEGKGVQAISSKLDFYQNRLVENPADKKAQLMIAVLKPMMLIEGHQGINTLLNASNDIVKENQSNKQKTAYRLSLVGPDSAQSPSYSSKKTQAVRKTKTGDSTGEQGQWSSIDETTSVATANSQDSAKEGTSEVFESSSEKSDSEAVAEDGTQAVGDGPSGAGSTIKQSGIDETPACRFKLNSISRVRETTKNLKKQDGAEGKQFSKLEGIITAEEIGQIRAYLLNDVLPAVNESITHLDELATDTTFNFRIEIADWFEGSCPDLPQSIEIDHADVALVAGIMHATVATFSLGLAYNINDVIQVIVAVVNQTSAMEQSRENGAPAHDAHKMLADIFNQFPNFLVLEYPKLVTDVAGHAEKVFHFFKQGVLSLDGETDDQSDDLIKKDDFFGEESKSTMLNELNKFKSYLEGKPVRSEENPSCLVNIQKYLEQPIQDLKPLILDLTNEQATASADKKTYGEVFKNGVAICSAAQSKSDEMSSYPYKAPTAIESASSENSKDSSGVATSDWPGYGGAPINNYPVESETYDYPAEPISEPTLDEPYSHTEPIAETHQADLDGDDQCQTYVATLKDAYRPMTCQQIQQMQENTKYMSGDEAKCYLKALEALAEEKKCVQPAVM